MFVAKEEILIRQNLRTNASHWFNSRLNSIAINCLAEFRVNGYWIADDQFTETTCSLCYEDFQIGDRYSQWSCQARHTFHHSCMLNVFTDDISRLTDSEEEDI